MCLILFNSAGSALQSASEPASIQTPVCLHKPVEPGCYSLCMILALADVSLGLCLYLYFHSSCSGLADYLLWLLTPGLALTENLGLQKLNKGLG